MWEKYDAKGWTEKGAHKYGRLNEQSWWEKWGEHYDGRGSILKWTDKWAETEIGTKWGDKWEEKFYTGIGSRQGETWHVSPSGERWSRTWGEEHFGNGKAHKYGKSTTGEKWDIVVDEETYSEAEPHYGWAGAVGDLSQLLSIQPRERPPGVFPSLDFGSSRTPPGEPPEPLSPLE
ncbi:Protein EARLY STARVATION 1, chloroplastic [Orobanche gracilis]